MSNTFDLILHGGTCATPSGIVATDIAVTGGQIAAMGDLSGAEAKDKIDVSGLHVLPGVIDSQVHFREPGLEHKEDFATGTAAAAMGGVTGVFEMPNTQPLTLDPQAIADKCRRAKGRAWVNMAFFIGAAAENAEQLGEWENLPGCSGVKIFMGSSTGSLLVPDDETLRLVLANSNRRCSVHCEDEPRLKERFALVADGADVSMHPEWRDVETAVKATRRLLALARPLKRRVHVLHVTTAEEMELLKEYRDVATVECTPQHLTLAAPDCYEQIGSLAQMNPPIRDARHREALWKAVDAGLVDVLGSDHAPHTLDEKANPYPKSPSGMPGVQTLVPVMLNHVAEGRLTLERFVDLTASGPQRIFGIQNKGRISLGYDGDFTVVDLNAKRTIKNNWIVSKCGWTPYDGMKVTGWPIMTILKGDVVMREDQLIGDPKGGTFRFLEAL